MLVYIYTYIRVLGGDTPPPQRRPLVTRNVHNQHHHYNDNHCHRHHNRMGHQSQPGRGHQSQPDGAPVTTGGWGTSHDRGGPEGAPVTTGGGTSHDTNCMSNGLPKMKRHATCSANDCPMRARRNPKQDNCNSCAYEKRHMFSNRLADEVMYNTQEANH